MEPFGGTEGDSHGEKPSSSSSPPPPPPPPPPTGFWELFKFADGLDYVLMAVGTVGAIGHGCSLPTLLRVTADLVNSVGSNPYNSDKMMKEVVKFSFYFLVVGAALCVLSWAEIACWTLTGERQTTKMRIKYLEAALNQDIQFYDTEIRTSDVVYGMTTDVVTVQQAISAKMGNFIHYVTTFVAGFIVGFSATWKVALVTLVVSPLVLINGAIYGAVSTKFYCKYMDSVLQSGNIAEETIVQIRAVKAYVGESRALQAYSAALRIVVKLGRKCGLVRGVGLAFFLLTAYPSYALLIWYGGIAVRHHYANGALVNATISIIMVGGQALGQAAPILNEFAKARSSAAKIFRVIDHVPVIDRNNDSGLELELDSVTGQIEFRNVDFSYPARPEIRILNNLSFTIPAGRTVALVGSSGSGKSTVVSLIERFYDPTSGQILVDGHDIKSLKLRWVRQQIGLVSQEPTLFATSIKENILLGRPDATTVEVEEAAKVANAHSFILKLPDGYDTQVGERGTQLSGGQKQRIAIARAMLKNPAILLLDEATSALDSESERLVQEALDRFMIARTTLVIAHRLSTIRKADLVAVLQLGSLVEMGKHDELIAMGDESTYAKLLKIQEAGHEIIVHNVGKSSARFSGGNSFSSPMIDPNNRYGCSPLIRTAESFYRHSPGGYNSPVIIAPGPCHGQDRSPCSTYEIFELSTPDHTRFSLGATNHASQKKSSPFWRLAKMNIQEWPYAFLACISSTVNGFIFASFCYILSVSLSAFYNPDNASMIREISRIIYILIGISCIGFICTLGQCFFWDTVAENLTKRLREKVLSAVVKNEMAWFDREENESSKLAARIALDSGYIKSAASIQISTIVQNSTLMLVACTASIIMQWRLTLVIMSVFPFLVGSALLQNMLIKGFSGDLEAAHATGTQLAGEAISNIRTIAAFNSESKMVGLFVSYLQTPLKRCFWRGQVIGSMYGVSQFALFSSYALGFWYGSWLIKHGMSDFSRMVRVLIVLMTSAETAGELLIYIPEIVKGNQAMNSMFQLLDHRTEIEPEDPSAALISGRLQGEVEFRHVKFTYPSRPNVSVFKDLSFRAQAGKTLALVGPSGCGKSSVIALIERFYEPSSGRIMIDGMDIRMYNLKSLRRRIALVPQEPCLFATSIYDNIAYGAELATEAEVIEAANLANVHRFISSLPDGYKTFAGERGLQLSGGQKQRIAIARAFLKKPDLMLLDEATSALDSESEREVQKALDRACDGKTTIVVAHRLAAIRTAHMIVVINEGKVVEQGSDSQLLRNPDGIYASMIHLQAPTHGQVAPSSSSSSQTKESQE